MAGDLKVIERVVIAGASGADLAPIGRDAVGVAIDETVIHRYGRVNIVAETSRASRTRTADEAGRYTGAAAADSEGLDEVESLGLAAFELRSSSEFREAKDNRPRAGESWDMPRCTNVVPTPAAMAMDVGALSAGPTSAYLEGTVAVGIVIVEGPTADLRFSDAERLKVVAEVQNGLGFLATANPLAGISFSYDIQDVVLDVPANPAAPDLEALWRDPAMGALGFSANWAGVGAYVEDIRARFGTRWTFCAFFTKYPLGWFAYASIGGPRLVMQYANDGWGPDNIDRVFAHETGHIFGAPDEYASSGCNCGGAWGRFGLENRNCENCAGEGGVQCLMKGNTFALCGYTPGHLGWSPQLVVKNFGYNAGGWRVDLHPRVLADTTGDGMADIMGFGNAGVWRSRAIGEGRFQTPELVIANFGYNAGGWRVPLHPRFVADTTGDGKADVIGFGNAGVWISRAQADGSYAAPVMVVANFGYNAGGWRVDMHPRFMADTTGDGRADIVGFGNAGVWVSLAQANGTYAAPTLVVPNFGYYAGGWRVDLHPRFVVDTTGDGRADIVGFGNAGVWRSRSNGNGTFAAPEFLVGNFGYNAGGWRVERHPRFLADTTGDGRLDIVGFGDAGVWISRALSNSTYEAPGMIVSNFGYNAGSWRVEYHPRYLADVTGEGRSDIIGFGNAGVWYYRS